ncbi:unnamed protein product [Brassica napus]|uniref:(rape) hypothetical protein n=1 Tax=Brassica napus TaxID=3708 RepID=A0A816SEB4_BRANA|nr:unnamed protein product [Brassica napus]
MKSQGLSSWALSFCVRVAAAISHGVGGEIFRVASYSQQQLQFPIIGLYKSSNLPFRSDRTMLLHPSSPVAPLLGSQERLTRRRTH